MGLLNIIRRMALREKLSVREIKRVSPTCLITFERNRYSVPASFANRPVSLRIYPERLVVAAEGNILCEHTRVIERSHDKRPRTIYDWRHYLAVIQRKPGALRNGAPFLELPLVFRQLQDQMLRRPGGDHEMADTLALVLLTTNRLSSGLWNWPWIPAWQPKRMC